MPATIYNRSLVDYRMPQKEKEGAAKELKQAVLASERNAWAWALKESRDVRRGKNVDFLKDFKDVKELKEYIDYFLGGYERLVEKVQEAELPYAGLMSAQEIEKYLKEE